MDSSFWNWLGGITMIVIIGVVVSNGRSTADILVGLGNLYGNVGAAATGGTFQQRKLP